MKSHSEIISQLALLADEFGLSEKLGTGLPLSTKEKDALLGELYTRYAKGDVKLGGTNGVSEIETGFGLLEGSSLTAPEGLEGIVRGFNSIYALAEHIDLEGLEDLKSDLMNDFKKSTGIHFEDTMNWPFSKLLALKPNGNADAKTKALFCFQMILLINQTTKKIDDPSAMVGIVFQLGQIYFWYKLEFDRDLKKKFNRGKLHFETSRRGAEQIEKAGQRRKEHLYRIAEEILNKEGFMKKKDLARRIFDSGAISNGKNGKMSFRRIQDLLAEKGSPWKLGKNTQKAG